MDSGLDVMERNVLHAELRGEFGVRAVEEVLRKHWSDSDIRKRDAEKGCFLANYSGHDELEEEWGHMGECDPMSLEAEGFSVDEIEAMVAEEERARSAMTAIQDNRRTLRDARARQHAVKMSRQFYGRPAASGGRDDSNRARTPIKCFRCGGPHRIAECKEKPKQSSQGHMAEEAAPSVFWNERVEDMAGVCDTIPDQSQSFISTTQAVAEGKAVLDGGATRTIGSITALERVTDLNTRKRGATGVANIDFSDRPVFGLGNSSKNQCASTADLQVPMAGRLGTMKVHALDEGSAPILLSIHSLRRLGAVIDFEHDLAVFRHVDPRKMIRLERSSAGHQLMPLTDDIYTQAVDLGKPLGSLKVLELEGRRGDTWEQ